MISLMQSGLLFAVLAVVRASCPKNWLLWNGHCYSIPTRYHRWHGARGECKKYPGADVVSITSKAEQDYLIKNLVYNKHTWLGMRVHKERSWWVDGSPVTYTNFGQQTPAAGDVVLLDGSTGLWSKLSSYSHAQKYLVCKMATCGCPTGWKSKYGRCFKVSAQKIGWAEARQTCQNMAPGADLAAISDSTINSLVFSMAVNRYPVWIGLNDREQEGKFFWGSTTPISFRKFHPGEPNGKQHSEDCIAMLENQHWADYSCHSTQTNVNSFACQQWICGPRDPLEQEDTRFGKLRIWRSQGDMRCPDGWSRNEGGRCFGGLTPLTTLDNAESLCAAQHPEGALAKIKTLEENDKAFLAAQTLPMFIDYQEGGFTNFQPGTTVTKGCAAMEATGQWSSDCEQSRPALCQTRACIANCEPGWVLFKGYCYREEKTRMNAEDAEAFCQKEGGHLTSILSQEENDFLFTLLFPRALNSQIKADSDLRAVFIGAWRPDRTSDWAWRDCAPWTISRWRFVDGNLTSDTLSTCATLLLHGRWLGKTNCDNKYRFVCKKDPCHKQFGPLSSYGCPSDRPRTIATTTAAPAPVKSEQGVAVSSARSLHCPESTYWRNGAGVCFTQQGIGTASFQDAFMACSGRQNGSDFGYRLTLPIVYTYELFEALAMTAAKGHDVWLGLTRRWTGYWYWHDRIRVFSLKWGASPPTAHPAGGGEGEGAPTGPPEPRCAALDGKTGYVVKRHCSDQLRYHCQATPAYYL